MAKKTRHKMAITVKHLMDRVIAVIVLILLIPLLSIIALAIKMESKGPFLFRQQRVGRNGKLFHVYKFRTMIEEAEHIGLGYKVKTDDPRITKVGNFLRTWSLDEIPQLINIIMGDMSFVGPRPTLPYQADGYTSHQRKRLNMKPGITGWAQVNGRNSIPWEVRIELDIWYVENWSLWLDIKIIMKTAVVIIKRESVYNQNDVSYDFRGIQSQNTDK